ncbi:MAG TPA: MFS transporter, partial [Candidatus Deferrimicrobium sp.]|nr:MFS transporter [Candidatus Deferrimicrobium sp.]
MVSVPSDETFDLNGISAERNLILLSFASFVRMLGISIIDLILVIYAISLGADPFLSGLAVGAFSIAQVIFQIPMAKLSDRIGRKKTLLIGMSIFALGTLLCGIAQNISQLILFRLVQGSGAYISVIQAFIGDMFPSGSRGKAMSYYQSGVTLGYAIGLPLGGFFASLFLNLPFFVNFGLIIVSMIFIQFFVRDPEFLKVNHTVESNDKPVQKIDYKREFFQNRLFLLTTFVDCLLIFVFSSLLVFLAPFGHSLGLSTFEISMITLVLVLIMTLGFFIGGRYSDRTGRSNLILIGISIAACALLIQGLSKTPLNFIFTATFLIFGIGLAWPTVPALIMDSVSEPCRATGTS